MTPGQPGAAAPHFNDTSIDLTPPTQRLALTAALLALLAVAVGFAAIAPYTAHRIASGALMPKDGVIAVVPPRTGRILRVEVTEGQVVRQGALLARVGVPDDRLDGGATNTLVLRALADQMRGAGLTQASDLAALELDSDARLAREASLRTEIGIIEQQIAIQRTLVTNAEIDLARSREIARRGFISARDLAERVELTLTRRQALAELERTRTAKLADLVGETKLHARGASQARAAKAAAGARLAALRQEVATVSAGSGFALRAPVGGVVSALSADTGNTVAPGTPLMYLVPRGGRLEARLLVSDEVAGYVRPGQAVRVSLTPYPALRYGTLPGRVVSVSRTPVPGRDPDQMRYAVRVRLDPGALAGFARRHQVLPGMSVTARIFTERKTLLAWLFPFLVRTD